MTRFHYPILVFFILFLPKVSTSQHVKLKRENKVALDTTGGERAMIYHVGNDRDFVFKKPRTFDFLLHIPGDFANFAKQPFRKKNLPEMGILAGSTALLIACDQSILDGTQQFGNWMGIDPSRKFKSVIRFGEIDVLDIPDNFNSVLYFLGEGWPSVLIGVGYFTYGTAKKDYRALQTASQLAESFLTMGITTQFIKRFTGRESPFVATQPGGVWRPFPNPKEYQSHVPKYDAFPSGHLATAMATVTILSSNYPEYRGIKPIGYSLMGLIGFAMVNNSVHWVSDYPLAIAIGYTFGKIAVEKNRVIVNKEEMQSSLHKVKTTLLPIVYNQGAGVYLKCTF